MPRPSLELGTYGNVKVYEVEPKKFKARCRYRHFDGKIYWVERYGTSENKAINRLKAAIRDWVTPARGAEVTAKTKFRVVAVLWLERFKQDAEAGHRSLGSYDTYRSRLEGVVLPKLGELEMIEITTGRVEDLCLRVRSESSASSARTVRAIVSGVCALAVRNGALDSNPVKEVGPLESRKAKNRPTTSRALTDEQILDLLSKLDADEVAIEDDLPDLARFFAATGERTGEALAAHWPDFKPEKKLISMAGNVIRARGRGKILNRGKTENSPRDIPLADWAVTMLLERRALASNLDGPIFPSSAGTVREAANVRNRAWKPFVGRAGYEWVTFRTFRKTVATLLDEAGLTARQIADILGHSRPSMTQDVYMGRGTPSRAGAEALDGIMKRGNENVG